MSICLLIVTSNFQKTVQLNFTKRVLLVGKPLQLSQPLMGAPVESGDILSSDVKPGLTDLVNQRLTPLQEKMETMMVSADTLLVNLNTLFDTQTKTNIKSSIAELSTTIASFKSTSESLNV